MARRRGSKGKGAGGGIGFLAIGIIAAFGVVIDFISQHIHTFVAIVVVVVAMIIFGVLVSRRIKKQRRDLLGEILDSLDLQNIESLLKPYDDQIVVKSRQTLENYDDIKYLKEKDNLRDVKNIIKMKAEIQGSIGSFLAHNEFGQRRHYSYVAEQLKNYYSEAECFRVKIKYITPAGNNLGEKVIKFSESRISEFEEHPEYLMTKGEYNKLLKQQEKEELDEKKHFLYYKVNSIIDFANNSKDLLIVKSRVKKLDELIQQLFDRTINSIQKIKTTDSDEWQMLYNFIADIDKQVKKIVSDDKMISRYYESEDFLHIKETCNSLNASRKEFNEYIEEKAQSISKLFGTRIVRNETKNEDTFNYIRSYKKSITPFTAEVSSTVFGSAENNPIDYIIKYFYPDKSLYNEQIQKLRVLIEELETLKEAKVIIDNFKKDYDQYIQNVPDYVLANDEDGFYSRLGLAIIDEECLNVEYKFTYTSDGGMAQRSFTVPMKEETIIELITRLESKLSLQALSKEQRALMTTKLRTYIKERDNFTCCQCGNSTRKEPNLLLEVDHVIPISKGGLTKEDNLQTLCWKCNRSKGAKIMSSY